MKVKVNSVYRPPGGFYVNHFCFYFFNFRNNSKTNFSGGTGGGRYDPALNFLLP